MYNGNNTIIFEYIPERTKSVVDKINIELTFSEYEIIMQALIDVFRTGHQQSSK